MRRTLLMSVSRKWKVTAKLQGYTTYKTTEERLEHCIGMVEESQWPSVIHYWDSAKAKLCKYSLIGPSQTHVYLDVHALLRTVDAGMKAFAAFMGKIYTKAFAAFMYIYIYVCGFDLGIKGSFWFVSKLGIFSILGSLFLLCIYLCGFEINLWICIQRWEFNIRFVCIFIDRTFTNPSAQEQDGWTNRFYNYDILYYSAFFFIPMFWIIRTNTLESLGTVKPYVE